MSLKVGIIGLPNVGKSTLFNALLKKQIADVSAYPFCTIEPNKGIVEVPDGRLPVLAEIVGTARIIPAVVEFIDIAGLVKGAHKGEGLGNKFLSHIREVAVICHVIRFFKEDRVAHVSGKISPLDDVEIVNSELILADLQTLGKQKKPRGKMGKEEKIFWDAIEKLKAEMDKGVLARDVSLSEEERKAIEPLSLLTAKPVIYLANVSENKLSEKVDFSHRPLITLSAKMESEVVVLSGKEQEEYLSQYGLEEPGLNRLVKVAYETLGLISFLTAGEKEVRAWTIKKGISAKEGAGVIHSDFEKNFIKAEVVSFDDFVQYQGWINARSLGKVKTEGKDYQLKDGDVVEFKIGR